MEKLYDREIENRIKRLNDTFRVLALTGPRQVGKSTVLEKLLPKGMTKVSLDDKSLRDSASKDPKLFIETYPAPLFIDEIQYAPELFSYIKMVVDHNDARGQYWLSGSQVFNLMKGVTESLAGRVGILEMNSFRYTEIIRRIEHRVFDPDELKQREPIGVNQLFELIYDGGMPETYKFPDINRDDYYASYVDTYIERDVKQIKDIGSVESFRKFMQEMAIRIGTTLNYSDIASDVGVDSKTIKAWVSVLAASKIIYLLPAYSSSKIKRLTRSPKIIFMDTGLASYLAGWESARDLQLSDDSGRFLESYVISEIIKGHENNGKRLELYHVRRNDKEEIDLLMFKNRTVYPLEIKKTASPKQEMLKHFEMIDGIDYQKGRGGIICCYDRLMPLDNRGNYIIPISSVIDP